MIVYFDTSALVKRYVAETGTDAVLDLWSRATLLASSQLVYAEMLATFARKRREQPQSVDIIDRMQQAFRADFDVLVRLAIDEEIHRRVDGILGHHALRGADAVHLASALLVRDLLQEPVTFACADARLVDAARAEGMLIAP